MHGRVEPSHRSPLSPVQRDLLLESSSGAGAHVISTSLALPPGIDLDRWQNAARLVFASQPGLRLKLVAGEGGPQQAPDVEARLATKVIRLDETAEPDLDSWAAGELRARPPLDQDLSFVHALVHDRAGTWHAVAIGPHVFVDGQTFRIFFELVADAYGSGNSPPDGSLSALFDAIDRAAHGMDEPETVAFWRERLRSVAPLTFRTAPEARAEDVDQVHWLGREESTAVEDFCRRERLHPSDFFLAVFAVVLERFREREAPWLVHTIRSTRGQDERALVGCFFRTLPVVFEPADVAAATSFTSLFAALQAQRGAIRGRTKISMLALQDQVPRAGARAIFNYYNFTGVQAFGGAHELRSHFLHRADELHLVVVRREAGFELRARFNTSSFSERRLLPRLAAVALQAAAGAPTIGDCNWLLPDEQPIVAEHGGRPLTLPEEAFAEHARTRPEATALTFGVDHLSFGELDALANRLARRLVALGAGPGTLVAVHVNRSLEQIAAILGILKAGAAFVPIDPDYPDERVRLILSDSRAPLLVGYLPAEGTLPPGCILVPFSDVRRDFGEELADPTPTRASIEDLAYVIYTSGSTGTPKGTLVSRRNLANLLAAAPSLFDFGPGDTWTLLHSCAFDFSVWETFGALCFGGRLVIVPAGVARVPTELARLIDREGVTVLNQTPSAFYHLAEAEELKGGSLRLVIFGGEALETRRLARWLARFGDRQPRLVNMYGITETTVHVTHRPLSAADAERDVSPIGRPLPGWSVDLVDVEGRLVPRGCSGEMWVGGAGVAMGYLHRDELTAERFVPDHFRSLPRRLYRSGDLARETPGGELQFLARIDDQVKIRGYRVELGEVAAVLAEHAGVREAVVLAHRGPEGAFLVGYVVPAQDAAFDEGSATRFIKRRLPAYMTCTRILPVAAFPLTAHGKLDRHALPAPDGRPPDSADFIPPRTATEELVAGIFAEATGAERVGAEDNFFDIGGHSLSAMRVASRLRDVFRVQSTAALVFERQTVAGVAEYVARQDAATMPLEVPTFERQAHRDALPLTFAQERVFVLQRLFPDMLAYNFQAMLGFRGRLDAGVLARALAQLVERHEAFRTTFHDDGGRPVQRVHERGVVAFAEVDLSHLPAGEAAARLEALRQDAAARRFDPSTLPLVEWQLVRLSPSEHRLLHSEHHLTHDGWSFVVAVRDLLDLYRALSSGRPAALPPCTQPGDYAAGHRRWLTGPAGAEQRRYWAERLAGIPERLDLPADRARPPVFSYRGDQLRFDLPPDLVARIRAVAQREALTLYMVLLGAFSLVLSRLSGADDVGLAAGIANRRWEAIEDTVGMLLNNVVFRLRPRAGTTARAYLREVRAEVLGALANQDLPFDEIVAAAGVPRSPSETPLGAIFFSAYEGPLPDLRLPELEVELEAGLPNGSAKFDWNVIVISQPGGSGRTERVSMIWEYATDLFERGSIERAKRQLLVAADALIANLDRPLAELSISDAGERAFLMTAAEGPQTPYSREASIPEMFSRQAAARGTAVALRTETETLTYAELDQRSDSIARGLAAAGIELEEPVGLLFPRGPGAVIAMLGVLKAGGAYLPLSPKDPPARTARLVAEAGARIVLAYDASATHVLPARVLTPQTMPAVGGAAPREQPRAGSLASIMFTSGSTGQPKGVEVLHRGVVRLLFGADYAAFGPDETILQLAPLSFDASTFEIWGALLHGGTLVIFPDDLPSAASLGDAIRRHGVTTMWLNASLYNAIVDDDASALAPLRQLLIGGESLSPPHVERGREHAPGTRLVNGYGPTENTTFSCCYEIPADLDPAATSIPIGRPIAHSRARILDADRGLSPAGAVGEIYVGGDGLARGYRSRASITEELFVPDPFDSTPGARLYRTGDLGRVRLDGTLEYRGRRDAQVKIRGHRIEPGEVEAALCRVTGVAEAAVVMVDDPVRSASLAAFVVPTRGTTIHALEVQQAVAEELPAYMVPARVIVRESLPLTTHAKVDARLLARDARRTADMEEMWPPMMPKTALEGVVAAVFAEVLGQDRFEADQDFFAAGGHSLLVLRALARIERALSVRLEPSVFLHGPTPRQLARQIEQRVGAVGAGEPARSIVRVSSGDRALFFVPGGEGGDVSLGVYARLALHLPGVAFHGLRLVHEETRQPAAVGTVEEMARAAIEDLLRIQPDGTVDLVGGCIGGLVAYEMARQLEEAGRPPRSVAMLDTVYPSLRREARHRLRGLSARTRRVVRGGLRMTGLRRSRQDRVYASVSRLLPFPEHEASPLVPNEWLHFVERLLRYRPRPLRMPVTLLATRDLTGTGSVDDWRAALGDQLTVVAVPGTHWSYIRQHIAETAAVLRETLEPTVPGS